MVIKNCWCFSPFCRDYSQVLLSKFEALHCFKGKQLSLNAFWEKAEMFCFLNSSAAVWIWTWCDLLSSVLLKFLNIMWGLPSTLPHHLITCWDICLAPSSAFWPSSTPSHSLHSRRFLHQTGNANCMACYHMLKVYCGECLFLETQKKSSSYCPKAITWWCLSSRLALKNPQLEAKWAF